MKDQAESLRLKISSRDVGQANIISVVSGKGGVGKSNISANMAVLLAARNKKVCIIDLDIGMGNVDMILGSSSAKTMADFIFGEEDLGDIVQHGMSGVSFIAGGNGFHEVPSLGSRAAERLLSGLRKLQRDYDYIIFDMAAGAADWMLGLCVAADDIIVITTPEAPAIMDAYSMMKLVNRRQSEADLYLICNRADSDRQGMETYKRLEKAMGTFLQKEIRLLGILPEDKSVRKAVLAHRPFCLAFPRSAVSVNLRNMVDKLLEKSAGQMVAGSENSPSFISRLRRLFEGQSEK